MNHIKVESIFLGQISILILYYWFLNEAFPDSKSQEMLALVDTIPSYSLPNYTYQNTTERPPQISTIIY